MGTTNRGLRSAILTGLAMVPMPVLAWDIDWGLGLGFEYSDNLGRRTLDPISGNTISPFFDIEATEEGDSLRANIVGSFRYDYYAGDAGDEFSPNFVANLGANVVWELQPERWLWTLDNYASQQPIDPFATEAPDNVQNTNVFATGPTFLYRFSEAMSGRTEVRYVNSYADEDDSFNSNRFEFDGRMLRDLSELTTISANGSVELVNLSNPTPTAPDFSRYSLYGGYDWRSTRTTLRADLGWNWVDFDDLDSRDGLLARLIATVAVTPISTFDAAFEHRLSDTATDFASAVPDANSLLLPGSVSTISGASTITSDVYQLDRLDVGYTRTGQRVALRLGGYGSDQDYETNPALSQRNHGALATIDYSISALATFGVFGVTDWQDFTESDVESRESAYGLRFTYRVLRNLDLGMEATRADRSSDLPDDDFDENRIYVAVTWRSE